MSPYTVILLESPNLSRALIEWKALSLMTSLSPLNKFNKVAATRQTTENKTSRRIQSLVFIDFLTLLLPRYSHVF